MGLFSAFNQMGPMGAMGGMMGRPAYGQQPQTPPVGNPWTWMIPGTRAAGGMGGAMSQLVPQAMGGGMGGAMSSLVPQAMGQPGGPGLGGSMASLVPQVMGQARPQMTTGQLPPNMGYAGGTPGFNESAPGGAPVAGNPNPTSLLQGFAGGQVQGAPVQPVPQPGMSMAAPFQRLMSQFGPMGGMSPSLPGNVGAFMGGAGRWAPFGSMGAFG